MAWALLRAAGPLDPAVPEGDAPSADGQVRAPWSRGLHAWGARPPSGTGLGPASLHQGFPGWGTGESLEEPQVFPPGGSQPPMAPSHRWEDWVQGSEEPPGEPCYLSHGRRQLCMNQRSKFRKCEGIMQLQGKVDGPASGWAAGQWAGLGEGRPLGRRHLSPRAVGRTRRPRRTRGGQGSGLGPAASSSLAAGAFTAPSALALGIGFQAVGAECKATRLGGARAKPLGPRGLLPGYPALPRPPAPLALYPPKLPPHPAWWPPRVQGCTGDTAGFPVSQRCVSVAARELRIRARPRGAADSGTIS